MKVAIWLDADYCPEEGGGFSYYDKLVKAIDNYCFSLDLDICFVSNGDITALPLKREKYQLYYKSNLSFVEKIKAHIPLYKDYYKPILQNQKNQAKNRSYVQQLHSLGIDIIYYLRQGECHIENFPFVVTNWDIGHSSTYAFPELAHDGQFESRSRFYNTILPKALFVLAESEAGKQELIQYTHISGDKIKVVPIFAGNCVEEKLPDMDQQNILQKYNLTSHKFFFYPAQFWAHKNHYGLLQAFAIFHQQHLDYKLVLTGADKGNLSYVKSIVEQLHLTEAVIFPGFVSTGTINTFYAQCTSLVMASYFGPTNMPPIEAMQLGCPVICSDISGHHEILEDAALYFDPANTQSIVDAMEQVSQKRVQYVKSIKEQNIKSKFTVVSALQSINNALLQLVLIRSTWQ